MERADAKRKNMGLTTWKSASEGKIQKFDVSIAKNYLTEKEIDFLNCLVSMYLDYAEIQAEQAKLHAETQFEKYRIVQDQLFKSDFDMFLESYNE